MKLFIVWTPKNDNILGIFHDKHYAYETKYKYNENSCSEIEISKQGKLCTGMTINLNTTFITQVDVNDKCNKLYFSKIEEDRTLYICSTEYRRNAIEDLLMYFDTEHNREKDCENCSDISFKRKFRKSCRYKFKQNLSSKKVAYINTTDYGFVTCSILCVKIKKK